MAASMEEGGGGTMRERDLVRQLPYFPAPIEELQCEAETQVTLKRANRVVAALR